jgi:outer membrane protein OmpA-like peptidoglycan-associated protein
VKRSKHLINISSNQSKYFSVKLVVIKKQKLGEAMKKIRKKLLPLLAIPFSAYAVGYYADQGTTFTNENNLKEYSYQNGVDTVFWYEKGRPYWRNTQNITTLETYTPNRITVFSNHFFGTEKKESSLEIDENIYFRHNESTLTVKAKEKLREAAKGLLGREKKISEIRIEGFASRPGTKGYNLELSRERALAVKDFLEKEGLDSEILKVAAYGEKGTLSTPGMSRRTEIEVQVEEDQM